MLREYQTRTAEAVRQEAIKGKRRILVVMPTGAGKTHTMSELTMGAMSKGNRTLALMHRRGLVEQMMERFASCGIETGCIMAGKETNLDCQCQVASLWTYVRRLNLAEKDFNRFWVDTPFVLIDEAHHALNNTYKKILKNYEKSFVIGFTATPTLSTGAGLGDYFDSLVNVVTMDELLDGGFLVPGDYYGPSDPDLSGLKIVQGDYEKKGLDEKFNKPRIVGDVVDNWLKLAGDKRTMVFSINRKHGKALCNEFLSHKINAEYLDAHSDDEERSGVLRRFDNGDTQVICQVALFTEGTDIPSIQCLVIARPTRSLGLHRQILGRGARPYPGKKDFMVLDHGGNVKRLGYYEDEIDWSLSGKPLANKPYTPRTKEKTIIDCPMCRHLFTGPRCPKCGHEINNYGKKIEVVQGDLVKLKGEKAKYTMDEKRAWYCMFEHERRRLGKTESWLLAQYKSKFGVWPRKMDEIGPVTPSIECQNWLKYQRIKYFKGKEKREKQQQVAAW